MPHYCDSKKLEKNWFNWIVSSSVPSLEKYRELGLLWTKIVGKIDDKYLNHSHPKRLHCLALGVPLFFESNSGKISTPINDSKNVEFSEIDSELSLTSNSWLHNFDNPLSQKETILQLLKDGYYKEPTTHNSWHSMLYDINETCKGIAKKFNVKNGSIDLQNEALMQVMIKLSRKKLVYIPGKAPVFNLLTTTIHRCIISILIKNNGRVNGIHKMLSNAQVGSLPNYRSLKVHTGA